MNKTIELNEKEINSVSGAGIIAWSSKKIGIGLGAALGIVVGTHFISNNVGSTYMFGKQIEVSTVSTYLNLPKTIGAVFVGACIGAYLGRIAGEYIENELSNLIWR